MTIEIENKLKALQVRRTKAAIKSKELDILRRETQKEYDKAITTLTKLEKQIQNLTSKQKNIIISEHAILRFIERAMSFNIEEIKAIILPGSVKQIINEFGDGDYPIDNGHHKVVVKNGVIITVI